MTDPLDTEWEGHTVYIQPGGCVEISQSGGDEGEFIHVCDWGGLVKFVNSEIDRRKPYRDPREES